MGYDDDDKRDESDDELYSHNATTMSDSDTQPQSSGRADSASVHNVSRDKSSVHIPPLATPHPLLRSLPPMTHLPVDLLDLLDRAYFLHLLANDPSKVLPPGKSLLSVLSRPRVQLRQHDEPPTLQSKVEEMIHKAFWDEALDTLSSNEPSIQFPRLKLLLNDLHTALMPLFPSTHPILTILAAPLPPTSSPLLMALNNLREVLIALRGRCAPARDEYIDTLSASLAHPPAHVPDLAKLAVETARSLLKLAETMKDDLSQFVLGTMGESQLAIAVSDQARERERALILDLWKRELIRKDIATWMAGLSQPYALIVAPPSRKWILRLVQALGTTDPVACSLPVKPLASDESARPPPIQPNTLPPPFFFSAPELFYIQNFLQAIVIAAALRALLPAFVSSPNDSMYRIWTLLLASVNEEDVTEDAKIVNLADELVRASSLTDAEAVKLRSAVARTMRASDPVFLLLQRRLLLALAERMVRTSTPGERPTNAAGEQQAEADPLEVKGFGDPIWAVAWWIESIWAGLFEPRNALSETDETDEV
ncbi:hypothetical protein B0F90DRAFT_1699120 [Multifurca ochricompacta]|uniref:Uncharacterized protein n=1 Tax=Multifurca ochricompacta TaxID=376703 RepID=A0AAD4MAM5_9AGAM|nr:hypothetical protein B0F90DRAFT_1699120 [Multifurca ochricompacta]